MFFLLYVHFGRAFVHSEWRGRSIAAGQQGDSLDCAIYTMTHTMCLAMGYKLWKFDRTDPAESFILRRRRIAVDFLNAQFYATRENPMPADMRLPDDESDDSGEDAGQLPQKPKRKKLPSDLKADSRYEYFPDAHEGRDVSDGWRALDAGIVDFLPIRARARGSKYDHISTAQELIAICQAAEDDRYSGWDRWAAEYSLDGFKSEMEVADMKVRKRTT